MDELGILSFDQAQRFSVELQRRALGVNGSDALEQHFVQADRIHVRGNLRRQGRFGFLQHWIRVRLTHAIECRRGSRQQAAAALHGNQGVLEGWRRRIGGDFVDLSEMLSHTRFDCRLIVSILYFVERRRAKGQGARRVKRIGGSEIGRIGANAGNAGHETDYRQRSNFVLQVFRPNAWGSLHYTPAPEATGGPQCLQAA